MKIEVKITKTFSSGGLRALSDVTIDDEVEICGVKLIDGEKGTFVSMPRNKWTDKDGNDKYLDIVRIANTDTRAELFRAVKDAYQAFTQNQVESSEPIA